MAYTIMIIQSRGGYRISERGGLGSVKNQNVAFSRAHAQRFFPLFMKFQGPPKGTAPDPQDPPPPSPLDPPLQRRIVCLQTRPTVYGYLDKVFVSVYAITETNTHPAYFRICCGGSSYCFESNGTLLCGRNMKCHMKLKTECSLGIMATSAMFEFKSTSNIQGLNPPLFTLNGLVCPWPRLGNIGM